MEQNKLVKQYDEKLLAPQSGWFMLGMTILSFIVGIVLAIVGGAINRPGLIVLGVLILTALFTFLVSGFKIIKPNEALVLVLFGKYYGTIANEGFFWVNPFCTGFNPAATNEAAAKAEELPAKMQANAMMLASRKKISLKAMTLANEKQKVNDLEGNPIEIGVVVIWRIKDTAKAVFNVDNYSTYVSTQSDAAIRHVARQYPYDISDEGDEKSLRGSSLEIAEVLRKELQERVIIAGIEIIEARIAHLSYAPEIAAAMLQRQQAKAIIDARIKIVEGAVGMVEMALAKLSEKGIVELDNERKAAMVSNLLVVLCGNRDAQPIVNSGSIY
ncbi:MAG: SPFH domain-containing protein [Clostridia bacterium]|nr:SPFH domain-containing protein [Clostridia bacterium]